MINSQSNEKSIRQCGFTVVETLIFLAVTSAMFITVAVMINGQQARNEFTTSVREVESRLQDIANDVATGYYSNTNDFTCTAGASGPPVPVPTANADKQGSNQGCTFIGRVLQFSPNLPSNSSPRQQFIAYTVVGRQFAPGFTSPKEPASFSEAQPTAVGIYSTIVGAPSNATQLERINSGVTAEYVRSCIDQACASYTSVGSVGFFSAFSGGGVGIRSGAGAVNLVPILNTTINQTSVLTVGEINDSGNYTTINPTAGIEICLKSNGTRQYAKLRIGGNNRQLSIKTDIIDISGGGSACP